MKKKKDRSCEGMQRVDNDGGEEDSMRWRCKK